MKRLGFQTASTQTAARQYRKVEAQRKQSHILEKVLVIAFKHELIAFDRIAATHQVR